MLGDRASAQDRPLEAGSAHAAGAVVRARRSSVRPFSQWRRATRTGGPCVGRSCEASERPARAGRSSRPLPSRLIRRRSAGRRPRGDVRRSRASDARLGHASGMKGSARPDGGASRRAPGWIRRGRRAASVDAAAGDAESRVRPLIRRIRASGARHGGSTPPQGRRRLGAAAVRPEGRRRAASLAAGLTTGARRPHATQRSQSRQGTVPVGTDPSIAGHPPPVKEKRSTSFQHDIHRRVCITTPEREGGVGGETGGAEAAAEQKARTGGPGSLLAHVHGATEVVREAALQAA